MRKENFETHGDVRQLVPGRSWAAWARALGHLLPPLDVADIGCGEGYLTLEMARWARTVFGIDRSDQVLERAKALADRRRVTNVQWKKGDLARLPLRDASVDVALLSQALHHAADPEDALTEAVRVLRPGGRLLVLDLREHDQQWVRGRFGDQRLGFADAAARTAASRRRLAGRHGPGRRAADRRSVRRAHRLGRQTRPVQLRGPASHDPHRRYVGRVPRSGPGSPNRTKMTTADRLHSLLAHAHPAARRRHGHDDPAPQADGSGLPRRPVPQSSRATSRATATCSP